MVSIGFAPSKNQDMWNDNLFKAMANLTKSQGTCATFTAAGFVRRGLIEAGFDMKKVKGFGTKREKWWRELVQRVEKSNIEPSVSRRHQHIVVKMTILRSLVAVLPAPLLLCLYIVEA